VQRKQQVGECWVCVIFFAQVVVSEHLRRVHKGVRGGVQGQRPRIFFFGPTYFRQFRADIFLGPRDIRWLFGTWFFSDGFPFPVKELGFWTNPGHWVRVLDATGSYMYIVL
jgi:hypothetical protein